MKKIHILFAVFWCVTSSCKATDLVPEDNAAPTPTPVPEVPMTHAPSTRIIIKDKTELSNAIKNAKPGDTLALANGEWKDVTITFQATGTAEKPIVLTAQTKGQVTLTGQSDVRMAGEHLVLSGLVFKNGYAPSKTVISMRKDSKTFASHSRVTECVVLNYNNPQNADEKWISIFGKNNRIDHNHLEGKTSEGTTLVVWLEDEISHGNEHRIDHNFFGHRPELGKNGGETIRIGTSTTSMVNSNTVVENNYFYRCDGEAEIISIKSGENVIRNNVFYESKGSVVFRHGNDNIVQDNFFIGNRVSGTGGIRVINQGQQVLNNHLQELTGSSNKASLVVMKGVVNSELNGYHQVKDATIQGNVFINCSPWELGIGTREGQTLLPENSLITKNVFYNPSGKELYKMATPLPGLLFSNNTYKLGAAFQAPSFTETTDAYVKGSNGIWKKQGGADVAPPVLPAETGASWFKKPL